MDIIHERAAGTEISKRRPKIAVRVPGTRKGPYTTQVTPWSARGASSSIADGGLAGAVGHHGGDAGCQRRLESVLLSDGGPDAGDAGQRPVF